MWIGLGLADGWVEVCRRVERRVVVLRNHPSSQLIITSAVVGFSRHDRRQEADERLYPTTRNLLPRGRSQLCLHRSELLRRTCWADRGDAQGPGRRQTLDQRGTLPARSVLLHAPAWAGGDATGHLRRLAPAPHPRRISRGIALGHAGVCGDLGSEHRVHDVYTSCSVAFRPHTQTTTNSSDTAWSCVRRSTRGAASMSVGPAARRIHGTRNGRPFKDTSAIDDGSSKSGPDQVIDGVLLDRYHPRPCRVNGPTPATPSSAASCGRRSRAGRSRRCSCLSWSLEPSAAPRF